MYSCGATNSTTAWFSSGLFLPLGFPGETGRHSGFLYGTDSGLSRRLLRSLDEPACGPGIHSLTVDVAKGSA